MTSAHTSPMAMQQGMPESYHRDGGQKIGGIALDAPPWIAFWIITLLIGLPNQVRAWNEEVSALFGHMSPPSSAAGWDKLQLQLGAILDLLPMVMAVTAISCLVYRPMHYRWTERAKNLRIPPAFPDIVNYVGQLAPEITVCNLGEARTATYPRGFCRSGISVGFDVYKLWDGAIDERNAAKAILRHEISHCRQRDSLFLNSMFQFRAVLRGLPWVILTFGIIPSLVIWTVNSMAFLHEAKTVSPDYDLTQYFLFSAPSILLVLAITIVQILQAVTMPIAASWCAEFVADCRSGISVGQLKMLPEKHGANKKAFLSLEWITHPPDKLRYWLARRGQSSQLLVAAFLYPAAWLLQLAWSILLVSALYAQNVLPLERHVSSAGTDLATLTRWIGYQCTNWISKGWVYWVAAFVFITIWPLVGRLWRSISGNRSAERGEC